MTDAVAKARGTATVFGSSRRSTQNPPGYDIYYGNPVWMSEFGENPDLFSQLNDNSDVTFISGSSMYITSPIINYYEMFHFANGAVSYRISKDPAWSNTVDMNVQLASNVYVDEFGITNTPIILAEWDHTNINTTPTTYTHVVDSSLLQDYSNVFDMYLIFTPSSP